MLRRRSLCDALNAGISSYQCGLPGQYAATTINKLQVDGRLTDVGFYAEDDWKPKGNLTITYGMRLEAQNVINSGHDFAPRASFAYGIPRGGGKSPTTVVRGGFGIFYDRFTLANYLTTLQENGVNQVTSTVINPGAVCTPENPANCGASVANKITTYGLGNGIRSSYTMQEAVRGRSAAWTRGHDVGELPLCAWRSSIPEPEFYCRFGLRSAVSVGRCL